VEHYPGAKHLIIEGSDHGITEYPQYLDQVVGFAAHA
jgi:predicted esterase YcpF (UPF0227 family)